ncbi:MAG TPA: AAA family ATPase [Spirochaetota bacterium]|nr:AAA family ATPase [Spirochaetota bacterium]
MNPLPGYTIFEMIDETSRSLVHRGRRDSDGTGVVIKLLKTDRATPTDLARFRQEYAIIREIDDEGVVRTLDIIDCDGGIAIVMEDFGGVSLKRALREGKADLDFVLGTGASIASALGRLHGRKIIHGDIKPGNIIISADSLTPAPPRPLPGGEGSVKIADFGIARAVTRADENINDPNVIEGTLAYMSPEQTGRMNRTIDHRTDLYSLGVTLYEMLTGEVPFRSADPMEVIHAHIAKKPVPPHEAGRPVPSAISAIVMKLLAKAAEERYQSAAAVAEDLGRCLEMLRSNGRIDDFAIAANDIAADFRFSYVFVGREKEIGELYAAFERVAVNIRPNLPVGAGERSRMELVLVAGPPGIGKTALVNELQRPVLAERGYFISGKFEQYSRDIPYGALVQAFRSLAARMLAESPERLAAWRERLKAGFGNIGKVITDIVPELALVAGNQPDVPELGPQESQNRFNYAFRNFVAAITAAGPIVLFLDDLQWADMASLNALRTVAADPDIGNILIICAYRDTEVGAAHPAMLSLDDMRKSMTITELSLPPLETDRVNDIISLLLKTCSGETASLAELVFAKTGGNPFFVYQFLGLLRDRDLLKTGSRGWTWDMDAIRSLPVTENVVDLMAGKISMLPEETRKALSAAACIGTVFGLDLLAKVIDVSIDDALRLIAPAIIEGFLVAEEDEYRFTHDKIQEVSYILLPENDRNALHYRIGNILLNTTSEDILDEKIIPIADQLNCGSSMAHRDDEKVRLAGVNLKAARKAWRAAAFQSSYRYSGSGIVNLPPDSWVVRYDLCLELFNIGVQAAYLSDDYDGMSRLAEVVLRNARRVTDCTTVYAAKINSMKTTKPDEAIEIFLDLAGRLGFRLAANPTALHVAMEFIRSKVFLRGRGVDVMLSQSRKSDEHVDVVSSLTVAIADAIIFSRPMLFPYMMLKQLNHIFRRRILSDETPNAYITYGIILCAIIGDYSSGYQWGKRSFEYMRQRGSRHINAQAYIAFYSFVAHWKERLSTTLAPVMEAYAIGLETGDFRMAAHALTLFNINSFFSGGPLGTVETDADRFIATVILLRNDDLLFHSQMIAQITRNLQGGDENRIVLIGRRFNEADTIPVLEKMKNRYLLFCCQMWKMILCYFFGEYNEAYRCSQAALADLDAVRGLYHIPVYHFFSSLILLSLIQTSTARRRAWLKRVMRVRRMFAKWSRHAPQNHQHKLDLISAEIARIKGDYRTAEKLYDRAIAGAKENAYVHEEAIACERAANFYSERGLQYNAANYMKMAHARYTTWGAMAKVKQLEEKYPEYLQEVWSGHALTIPTREDDSSTSSSSVASSLDIGTVLKASRAISGEIDLPRLLETMLRIVMENAGADRGALIREKDSALIVEAEGSVENDIIVESHELTSTERMTFPPPNEGGGPGRRLFPVSIINYVHRTGETVLLDDAANRELFSGDPYVTVQKSKSILCAPIREKGKYSGILYLENNLVAGAFTPERLELLNIISSQAAISLENARLVAMEKEKAALDREIEMAEKIQRSLLPREIPEIVGARVAFRYVPMTGVGGDFVAIRHDAARGRLGLFICDVSGHGVPAAMTASMVSAALDFHWSGMPDDLPGVFRGMHAFLKGKMGGNFFTACLCTLDLDTGTLVLSSAGHPAAVVVRADGAAEMADVKGRLINEFFEPKLSVVTVRLSPGDRVVLYTDGITEAMNPSGAMLGADDDEFCRLVARIADESSSPDDLCDRIHRRVIEHAGTTSLQDDVTVLVCEYAGIRHSV